MNTARVYYLQSVAEVSLISITSHATAVE